MEITTAAAATATEAAITATETTTTATEAAPTKVASPLKVGIHVQTLLE